MQKTRRLHFKQAEGQWGGSDVGSCTLGVSETLNFSPDPTLNTGQEKCE